MLRRDLLRKVRQIQIRSRHKVLDLFGGHYHSVFKGQGMEFEEVRPYVPGDDVRSIDWNVTARFGHPFIKKFSEERELTVILLVDVSASLGFGSQHGLKREQAAEIAAVLALSASLNQDRVGLILFAEDVVKYLPPRRGSSHTLRLIREVLAADTGAGAATRLTPALTFLNLVTHRRAVVFLVSDFFIAEDFTRPLQTTARRHDLVALRLADPAEASPPAVGLVPWRDAETGRTALLDTSSRRVRQALRHRAERHAALQAERLRKAGVDLLDLSTDRPWERDLMGFFRRRERRRG